MRKAIFITNIPAHYRVALMNETYKILKDRGIEFEVVFSKLAHIRRNYWKTDTKSFLFNYYVLDSKNNLATKKKIYEFGFGIKKLMGKINPDVVVCAGFSFQTVQVSGYCKKNNVPLLVYSGETPETSERMKHKSIRNFLRRYIIKTSKGFVVYGRKAREYILGFDVKEENVHVVINTINDIEFSQRLSVCRKSNIKVPNLLFVGDLKNEKGIDLLLKSIKIVNEKFTGYTLTVVGDGYLKENLLQYKEENRLTNVYFAGKVDFDEIAQYYKDASAFILPSVTEPFGLVLVEAAIAGLPLLASEYAGGAYDLVKDGENGYKINPYNLSETSERILNLLKSTDEMNRMGLESTRIIKNEVNLKSASESFANAIEKYAG